VLLIARFVGAIACSARTVRIIFNLLVLDAILGHGGHACRLSAYSSRQTAVWADYWRIFRLALRRCAQ